MKAALRSLKRNAVALRRSPEETKQDYQSRLVFELRRRSNQLLAKLNPFDQDQYYFERLVGPLGIWPHLQQYQFNALTRLGLKPHHSIVDIGCGPITVGLTSGASTPDNLVGSAIVRLTEFAGPTVP